MNEVLVNEHHYLNKLAVQEDFNNQEIGQLINLFFDLRAELLTHLKNMAVDSSEQQGLNIFSRVFEADKTFLRSLISCNQ